MPTVRQITRFTEQEIKNLLAHARRIYRSSELDILAAPACHDYGRIVVITPGRIGNSPQRNTFRRQIKALFYEEKMFERKFDCVVIAKSKATTLTFESLKKTLLKAFNPSQL